MKRGILRTAEGGKLLFWCPGCCEAHQVQVGGGPGPRWGFNGDYDRPTFTPSINVTGVSLNMTDDELDRVFAEFKMPEDRERLLADRRYRTVCHSFVREGQIQFLGDCTHALAGQTVPLRDFDEA